MDGRANVRVRVRFDQVAQTDLTHFRIFPRNFVPDFTHSFSEQPEMSSQLTRNQRRPKQ